MNLLQKIALVVGTVAATIVAIITTIGLIEGTIDRRVGGNVKEIHAKLDINANKINTLETTVEEININTREISAEISGVKAELKKYYEKLETGINSIDTTTKSIHTTQYIDLMYRIENDLELVFEDFSSSLPNFESLRDLEKYRKIIDPNNHTLKLEKQYKLRILSEILEITNDITVLEEKIRNEKLTEEQKQNKISDAKRAWGDLWKNLQDNFGISSKELKELDKSFVNKIEAWRCNTIGVLCLMLYPLENKLKDQLEYISEAESNFETATEYKNYARPFSMFAVANSHKFEFHFKEFKEDPTNDKLEELKDYLEKGRKKLNEISSIKTPRLPRSLSTYSNMYAQFYIQESRLFEVKGEKGDLNKALSFLEDAQREIKKAKYHSQFHPAVYETEIEMHCRMIEIQASLNELKDNKKRLKDVLKLVEYGVYSNRIKKVKREDKDEFLKKYDYLKLESLGKLDDTWKEKLFDIVCESSPKGA